MVYTVKIILIGGDEELASTIKEFEDPESAGGAYEDFLRIYNAWIKTQQKGK